MSGSIETLVINGCVGLILALTLIKVFGKVLDQVGGHLVRTIDRTSQAQINELRSLRSDIRENGQQTAAAVNGLTDRVSRIEGKIEGIALQKAPEMSDFEDITPIGPIPSITRSPGYRAPTSPSARANKPR